MTANSLTCALWRLSAAATLATLLASAAVAETCSGPARKVNVGVSVAPPNVVHTSVYVAKELGFFAKHCIDANIIQFDGGSSPAAAVALSQGNTFTTVSGAIGDGVTGTAQDVAGIMMLNTTDLSTITATILNNGTAGSGIWICVGGFCKGVNAPASTAVGDYLVGSGSFVLARVAAGTASTFVPVATALTAVASNASDMLVRLIPVA